MSGGAKVVPLNPDKEKSDATQRAQLARLPAPVHTLHEKSKQLLLGLLRRVFDNADDALFDLADKAADNQEQNLYFESMRLVRIRRRTIEANFIKSLDKAFSKLSGNAGSEDDYADDVSLDSLSIVQNDELEQLVAADAMVSKANENCAESIQHLTLRINSLVPLKVYQKNNPVGPDIVCNAFTDSVKELSIDIKAKLVLLKLFDKYVVAQLGRFYAVVNKLLIDQNVLPSLKSETKARNKNQKARGQSGQQQAGDAQGNGQPANTLSSADTEVLNTLRGLLADQRGGEANAPAGPALGANTLLGLLSRIQGQQVKNTEAGVNDKLAGVDVRQIIGQALEKKNSQRKIGQVDDDVINLVNMMFEFILDDRNLAVPMKALIARLQIPFIKVAIADKSFFNKGGHPARRLLNELATASLGWQDDGKRKDPLYKKVDAVVQRILSDFETDVNVFNELLADFISFVDKEKRRASILEQRTIDAEDGKAKAQLARSTVAAALDERIPSQPLPDVAQKLLQEPWSNVLFLIYLKQGEDSEQWREALKTVDDLVWSVSAEPLSQEDRQYMLKLVPSILKRLRNGLESISYNPFEMTDLFKQLEKVHLIRLRGGVVSGSRSGTADANGECTSHTTSDEKASVTEQAIAKSSALMAAKQKMAAIPPANGPLTGQEGESNGAEDQSLLSGQAAEIIEESAEIEAPALPEDDQHVQQVDKLTQGTWFEMAESGRQPFRCRLAAIIKPTGIFIFVNRSGVKVVEKDRNGLAVALKSGSLSLLDDSMLFDRALEAVIGNLRSSRKVAG